MKSSLREFVAAGSTEVTPHDESKLEELARLLPAGYGVYVAHTPKCTLDDVVRVALRLRGLGLRASPHIVARRVRDLDALRLALTKLVAAGIDQILLIAGDCPKPEGPFGSTLELLESRVTVESGIRSIGVAGHPEGHPAVADDVLWSALERKQAFGAATGTRMHITTQFGFDTRTLASWEGGLAIRGIGLPIHAGIAGPTPFTRLLRYAAVCGVGASLKAVAGNTSRMGRLPYLATRAEEMLLGVYGAKQLNPDSRIFAPHFFAFGGVIETARWLRAAIQGDLAVAGGAEREY